MAVAAARGPPTSAKGERNHHGKPTCVDALRRGRLNRKAKDERSYEIDNSSRINDAGVVGSVDRGRGYLGECGTAAQARVRLSKQYNRWGQWRDIYELSSTGAAGLFENALDPVRSSLHHVFGSSRYT